MLILKYGKYSVNTKKFVIVTSFYTVSSLQQELFCSSEGEHTRFFCYLVSKSGSETFLSF